MSRLSRLFTACNRLNHRVDLWITVGVLLGFLVFDSIPIAAAIGVAIWLGTRQRVAR